MRRIPLLLSVLVASSLHAGGMGCWMDMRAQDFKALLNDGSPRAIADLATSAVNTAERVCDGIARGQVLQETGMHISEMKACNSVRALQALASASSARMDIRELTRHLKSFELSVVAYKRTMEGELKDEREEAPVLCGLCR